MQLILTEKDDKYTTINDHPLPKNIYKYNETHNDNGEGKYGCRRPRIPQEDVSIQRVW